LSAEAIESAIRQEIESLHEFFMGWFSGRLSMDVFDAQFTQHMDPEFVLIPPSGELLTLANLSAGLRAAHGSNPDFRIAIREVHVRRATGHHVLVTYQEWPRHALASVPEDNGRVSTALFDAAGELRWLHVHETWLPAAQMAAGPYDF
jgi:hypothetical protein